MCYDVILFSEVIYKKENYEKCANIICTFLNETGVCYLASKLFYFGVGGALPEFKQYLMNNYKSVLSFETTKLFDNKKGNKREIVAIKKVKL